MNITEWLNIKLLNEGTIPFHKVFGYLRNSHLSQARREHASLARQSAVLLSEAASDDRVRKALEEVHELTSKLLQEQEKYNATVKDLEVSLEDEGVVCPFL